MHIHIYYSSICSIESISCVNKPSFENLPTSLKENAKTKDSPISVYIDDTFFNKAKLSKAKQMEATPREWSSVKWKGWALKNGALIDTNNKEVVSFSKLHNVLTIAHVHIDHRGTDKTIQWIKGNYSEISQSVISSFVALCKIHAQQKIGTERVKVMDKPIISKSFFEIIEINLLLCNVNAPHRTNVCSIEPCMYLCMWMWNGKPTLQSLTMALLQLFLITNIFFLGAASYC